MPLLLAGIAALVWLLFFSEPGARWLTSVFVAPVQEGAPIGRMVGIDGKVKRIHGGNVEAFKPPLSEALELHDGDRVETDAGSKAVLVLNSQDEIELTPLTSVSLQLWNASDPAS